MDDIVAAALAKWPNVPHCRGWLGLDARGDWYLRDDPVQAAGRFPQAKGSRLEHVGLREFIERNYACDAAGAWYFQNGPQRVYVELEAAPWVWRLQRLPSDNDVVLRSHSGLNAVLESAWLDEHGRLFLCTDLGLGLVHIWTWKPPPTPSSRGCGRSARWPAPTCPCASASGSAR